LKVIESIRVRIRAMKRTVKLRTSRGHSVRIVLEHWGSGLDHTLRRWTLGDTYWECTDTGELADASGLDGLKIFSGWSPLLQLSQVEYALIIAVAAVVAWYA
jgi:hypothetical protein